MWVRNQEGTILVKCYAFEVKKNKIRGYIQNGLGEVLLGTYKNEHRASEVLYDIYECIKCKKFVVYNMPIQ